MIGDRIKEARLALGYSAEQVAAFLGVSPATVYRYENGDISKLPSKFIKPLAEFLCVSPAYLMGWTDDSTEQNQNETQMSDDIKIYVRDLSKLTPEQLAQAKNVFRAMFSITNPELFKNGDDDK